MKIQTGDEVKVLDVDRIDDRWKGQTGRVINIVGEVHPFSYLVKMKTAGKELVFRGNEIQTINRNL